MQKMNDLKILITAGPTWVRLDQVRVITNIFSGRTGYNIAKEAFRRGADVTLLLGPGRINIPDKDTKHFKIIRFKFYEDLLALMRRHIKSKKYDVVIHSSAVADYQPIAVDPGKIKSSADSLVLRFKPTIKIVDEIKKNDPNVFLVKFKLEVKRRRKDLLDIAFKSMRQSSADLMVANNLADMRKGRVAFILRQDGSVLKTKGDAGLANTLLSLVSESI